MTSARTDRPGFYTRRIAPKLRKMRDPRNYIDTFRALVLRSDFADKPFVFCIGLNKTGTTTLCGALETLGFRTLDSAPVARFEGGAFVVDWPWWMSIYDATTDLPTPLVFEELAERFPNSRFIHTTREREAWLSSCERWFSPERVEWRRRHGFVEAGEMLQRFYGSEVFDRALFNQACDAHDARVDAFFANRPLLRMNVFEGDGWPELCGFLGAPQPTTPFPHNNRFEDRPT